SQSVRIEKIGGPGNGKALSPILWRGKRRPGPQVRSKDIDDESLPFSPKPERFRFPGHTFDVKGEKT
ncbi:MAG: hypothetical protein ACREDR_41810, partial [Blastocatellia bacterium]